MSQLFIFCIDQKHILITDNIIIVIKIKWTTMKLCILCMLDYYILSRRNYWTDSAEMWNDDRLALVLINIL